MNVRDQTLTKTEWEELVDQALAQWSDFICHLQEISREEPIINLESADDAKYPAALAG